MKTSSLFSGLWLSLLALGVGLSNDARACWDGLRADSGTGVVVMYPYGGGEGPDAGPSPEWTLQQAHDFVVLLGRVEHLAGPGVFVSLAPWEIEVCTDDTAHHCVQRQDPAWGSPAEILSAVGSLVSASPAALRAAQQLEVPVWTVELLSAGTPTAAAALAKRIDMLGADGLHGSVEIGGFPADNPVAHRLAVAGGRETVVVGTFLHEADARAAADFLGDMVGPGTVRRLTAR